MFQKNNNFTNIEYEIKLKKKQPIKKLKNTLNVVCVKISDNTFYSNIK